jgi:hypothetical protein
MEQYILHEDTSNQYVVYVTYQHHDYRPDSDVDPGNPEYVEVDRVYIQSTRPVNKPNAIPEEPIDITDFYLVDLMDFAQLEDDILQHLNQFK